MKIEVKRSFATNIKNIVQKMENVETTFFCVTQVSTKAAGTRAIIFEFVILMQNEMRNDSYYFTRVSEKSKKNDLLEFS